MPPMSAIPVPTGALAGELDTGLAHLGLDLPAPARTQLLDYLALLARWNRTYNLSAVREPADMLVRHVFDSLAVLPHVRGPRVADIGSGPGLPGIVLAIADPTLRLLLVDSNGKMARFQREAIRALGLPQRCEVVQARAESLQDAEGFDTITSRAFASLADFAQAARGLARPDTRWLAMKGRAPDEEIAALPAGFRVEAVVPLTVPGLAAQRHAIIMAGPPGP
jgi:16S rRNA (guanine527-N7)-methyltransferase